MYFSQIKKIYDLVLKNQKYSLTQYKEGASTRQITKLIENDFKLNMDVSLNEIEIEKKELELSKEKFKEEKSQFESYKELELTRIKHANEIIESEKNQFEKYKEVTNRKIELENKNLQQKCDKLKDIINKFNSSFKESIKDENGV